MSITPSLPINVNVMLQVTTIHVLKGLTVGLETIFSAETHKTILKCAEIGQFLCKFGRISGPKGYPLVRN